MVNDLLDFQKLTAGHFSVSLAPVDVVDLVSQTTADNAPFADKFNVTVDLDAPEEAVFIQADPQRLKQVVTNLLSNASKFSTPGATVHVASKVSDGICTVSVSNNGPGISSEFAQRIFQPFSQQAEHLTRNREGTGLGLAISKELVDNMGGEIGFDSVPNVLTTFWVRFPIVTPDQLSGDTAPYLAAQ